MNLTLRDRLQNRRERIEAGLPPQEPVTMTDAFFAGNVLSKGATAECSKCREPFKPKGNQQVCGKCQTCTECGKHFTPKQGNYVTCSTECTEKRRLEQMRVNNAAYRARKREQERRRLAEMMAEAERKRREQHAA